MALQNLAPNPVVTENNNDGPGAGTLLSRKLAGVFSRYKSIELRCLNLGESECCRKTSTINFHDKIASVCLRAMAVQVCVGTRPIIHLISETIKIRAGLSIYVYVFMQWFSCQECALFTCDNRYIDMTMQCNRHIFNAKFGQKNAKKRFCKLLTIHEREQRTCDAFLQLD